MFIPKTNNKEKEEKARKKKILADIKEWCTERIPETYRVGLLFEVNEQICGDPSCAPIDTVFTFIWADGGRGMFALPLAPDEVQQEDIAEIFPDVDTLDKWKRGIRCRWPPEPALRFAIGERVECRVGPHPVKGWAAGRIVRLHYSEPNWPPNMVAPYQIQLHDGRLIYAPQDVDQLIRLRPPAKETDPPSPEVRYPEDGGDLDNDDDDDDNDVEMEDISGGGAP